MYPLTRASENFRKALKMANEISAEQETRYVGSEHFIYAFLCLPECSAYGILTREGVTANEYGEIFFKKLDKKSGYDGWVSLEFEGAEEPLYALETGLKNLKAFIESL